MLRRGVTAKRNSHGANYSHESSSACEQREKARQFPASIVCRLPTFLLSVLLPPARLSFSLPRPAASANGSVSSTGLEDSRPDWSSAEDSRSGRFGILKRGERGCVISFATNTRECKCDQVRQGAVYSKYSTSESNLRRVKETISKVSARIRLFELFI